MADYLPYSELITETQLLVKDFQADQDNLVKAAINMAYWELLNCDDLYPLFFLLELLETHDAVAGPISVGGITKAEPPVITATGHGLVTGDLVSFYDLTEMTELNRRTCHFTKVDANSGNLQDLNKVAIDGTAFDAAETTGGYMIHRGVSPSDNFKKIISAGFHGHEPMDPISIEEIERDTNWWDPTNLTRPTRFLHKQTSIAADAFDMILWYPGAGAAYDLRIWGERRPARMSADADIPSLPAQYHYAIVAGAVTRLAESQVQVNNAVVWPGIYTWNLNAVKAENRRWWKGQERKTYQEKGRKPYLL